MKINIYENNFCKFSGRLTKINPYANDKAANVVIALDNGRNANGEQQSQYLTLKSFKKDEWDMWRIGMKVTAYCHASPNKYTNADGQTVYAQDLVIDAMVFDESKSIVDNREASRVADSMGL